MISVRQSCATALVFAGIFSSPDGASAQPVTKRSLGVPEITFDVELSRVTALREFTDGRAVVVDSKERVVYLLDPQTRVGSPLGREGTGPGEYSRPVGLVSLPGDTILVADAVNNRFLVLGAGGRMLGIMPLVTIQLNANATYSVDINATDAQGRMYFLLPRGLVQNLEAGTPILRFDRKAAKFDTVGRVFTPTLVASQQQSAGPSGAMGMVAAAPFSVRDEWTTASDGSLVIVRSEPYHAEWTSSRGAPVKGPTVQYEPVPVTAAEKDDWRKQARERAGTMTTTTADGKTTQRTVPVPEPQSWPARKPAFVAPAMLASNGMLWIERSRAFNDQVTSYDVFAPGGRLAEQVTMPGNRRVVGFGNGTMYVSFKDEDDLLRIERHRLVR